MKILVTGATGFIGGHVADAVTSAGHDVIGLTRSQSAFDGAARRFRMLVGDIRDVDGLAAPPGGVDAVIHCAGRLPGIDGPADPAAPAALEVRGALRLAIKAGATRFVHLSSLAVCDPSASDEPLDEHSPLSSRPPSWHAYAISKIAEERAVRRARDRGWIGVVILRPGIVFGPRDRHATPLFLHALTSPIRFYVGTGDNPVASLVVEELAEAAVRAATRHGIDGRCYPLAGSERVTQRDLFRIHAHERGVPPPRLGVPRWCAIRGANCIERLAAARGPRRAPVTRIGAWIVGTPSPVDCASAAADLDWRGDRAVADAIARSIRVIAGGRP